MELINLLSGVLDEARAITYLGQTFDVYLNWIGKIIRWLVSGVGIVGVGIILFSIVLRAVVLPLDIYQRITMSKQNLKMQANKDKMEKLQKQYANDKEMYNKKLMEMYKESGISMFSSCLPAILSMVIFIVAINAFNAFSQYSNLNNYNRMVEAYNASITPYCAVVSDDTISEISSSSGQKYLIVSEEDKYVYIVMPYDGTSDYKADGFKYVKNAEKSYYVDPDKYCAVEGNQAAVDAYIAAYNEKNPEDEPMTKTKACVELIEKSAQAAVKEVYDNTVSGNTKFLWIKNIWETDATFKNPVLSYDDFKADLSNSKYISANGDQKKFSKLSSVSPYDSDSYAAVTGGLKAEKKAFNGYYILIVLSIGTILLQQFVSMRSQKDQQKYSSVDGSGGMNQKTMMIMMTVMFAIFSFMYSAAFSIYMIMSNVLSMVMTIIVNKLVKVSMDKKEQEAMQRKYNNRFPGRKIEEKHGKNRKK